MFGLGLALAIFGQQDDAAPPPAMLFEPSSGALDLDDYNTNTSFRVVCELAADSHGSIRVTFATRSVTSGAVALHCSIGKQLTNEKTTDTPIELLFGGTSGFTIPAGGTITSDVVSHPGLSLLAGDKMIVIVDYGTPGGQAYSSGNTNVDTWFYSNATSWNVADPNVGGFFFTELPGKDYAILSIETV